MLPKYVREGVQHAVRSLRSDFPSSAVSSAQYPNANDHYIRSAPSIPKPDKLQAHTTSWQLHLFTSAVPRSALSVPSPSSSHENVQFSIPSPSSSIRDRCVRIQVARYVLPGWLLGRASLPVDTIDVRGCYSLVEIV